MEDGESINVNVPTGTTTNANLTLSCPYCEPRCPWCGRKLEAGPRYPAPYQWPVYPAPVNPWPHWPDYLSPPWITWTYTATKTPTTTVWTSSPATSASYASDPHYLQEISL